MPAASERLSDIWLLVAAWVNTAEACMIDGLSPETRASLLVLEHGYSGPPRFGSFSSFCGLFVDVVHADGSTTSWPSSFARNASRHFHAEVFRVFNPSPVVEAVVTAILPASGRLTSATISDFTLRRLSFSDFREKGVTELAGETLFLYMQEFDSRQHRPRLVFRSAGLWLCPEDKRVLALLLGAALAYAILRMLWHRASPFIVQRRSHYLSLLRAVLQRALELLVSKSRNA